MKKKIPPGSVLGSDGQVYEVYRWDCNNSYGCDSCGCCRPPLVLAPWELGDEQMKQYLASTKEA